MVGDPIAEGRAKAMEYNGPGGSGFQNEGKLNAYQCEKSNCRAYVITIDREPGVTPFLTACKVCGGMAKSAMYRVGDHFEPTHEWVRPDSIEGLSEATIDHIRNGGLIMRPINAIAPSWQIPPTQRRPAA